MSSNAKTLFVSLLSLIGLAVLLVGLFTSAYDATIGIIVAIVCWAGSGILARYWGAKKKRS